MPAIALESPPMRLSPGSVLIAMSLEKSLRACLRAAALMDAV
jgi:hypothetical protein